MADLNAPGTGPAQAGTSVTSEATAQQSSGSSSEAGQENGQALAEGNNQAPTESNDQSSAGRGVESTTTSDGGILAPFSTNTISALKELSITKLSSHGDGPQNSRIGAHMLVSWDNRGSWILDRTDRYAISAEAWRPRSFTIDLAVPELPAVDEEDCFLPLEAFPLYDVREVTASDENGVHLSTLSSVDQRNAIGSMLVAFASIIVNADRTMLPDGSQTSEALRSAAFSRDLGPDRHDPE